MLLVFKSPPWFIEEKPITFAIAVRCIIFFVFIAQISVAKTLILATGQKGGIYSSVGDAIKEVVENNNPDLKVVVLHTQGSYENAELIDEGVAHLALIQNDIAYYYSKGRKIFKHPSDKMRGVISLYTEFVHIIARKDLKLKNLHNIINKTVSVGSKKSGTEFNARSILQVLGITYEHINEEYLNPKHTASNIISNKIDVAFFTAGIGYPAIKEIANNVDFLPLDKNLINKLIHRYPYFVNKPIPAKSYPGQDSEIQTCGVRALLVASKMLDSGVVKRVLKTIMDEMETIKGDNPALSDMSEKDLLLGMEEIPLHPGARDYYEDKGMISRNFIEIISSIAFPLILIIIAILIIKYHNILKRSIRRNIYIKLSFIFFTVFIIATLGMYFAEKSKNPNFTTVSESFWSSIVYLVSGFEDRAPVTAMGRLMSILIFASSVLILGSVAGNFAYIFIKKSKEVKMPKDIEKHFCICEWNEGGDKIIREIHDPIAEPEREILVITQKEVNEEELRSNETYEKVYFMRSDPTLHSTLKAARVHCAKSVIILADYECPDPDAKSALITLAVKKLCTPDFKPYIIVQAINHRKIAHIRDAGADEVVCATDFGLGIIAQSALNRKLVEAYQQLLSYSIDTNELYIVNAYPPEFIGKTFEEVAEILLQNRDQVNPFLLVGVRRNDQIILNPKDDLGREDKKFERFEEGDALIVMAYKKPDLSKLKI